MNKGVYWAICDRATHKTMGYSHTRLNLIFTTKKSAVNFRNNFYFNVPVVVRRVRIRFDDLP